MTIAAKVDHVRKARRNPLQRHHCHWPGCQELVPPAMWGCRKHWYTLPLNLRAAIWAAYEPGQEETKRPSPRYLEVAHEVQEWITKREERMKRDWENHARTGEG